MRLEGQEIIVIVWEEPLGQLRPTKNGAFRAVCRLRNALF